MYVPCQNDHSSNCPMLKKKEYYSNARRHFPLIDDPLKNWKCTEDCQKTCVNFKPYPPRMTEEDFKIKKDELLHTIPQELHSAVSYLAWERGHSAGYEEVISILSDIVDALEKPLQYFEERIRRQSIRDTLAQG